MVVKFKRKRRICIDLFCILVFTFFLGTIVSTIIIGNGFLIILAFAFQVIYFIGLYYYQAVRYDDEKITAQYGWPRIYYDDIISVKSKWGDIVIKSDKQEINISRNILDEESLKYFVKYLDKKTLKPLDTSLLLG